MASSRRSNYTPKDVRVLVTGWEELWPQRGVEPGLPLRYLCLFADLARAIARLGPKEYQAVLLCGQLQLDSRTAGALMGCSLVTMQKRYESALEMLTTDLNTGGL
jgi:DNA-directed RNA polymerase specialized sigma24 family protein